MTQRQIEINFEAGLLDRFPEFSDCVRASVYGCGRPFKVVAAELDMSPSELSRKLADNPNDPVHFPLKKLPALVRATADRLPVYWLVEAFLEDEDDKRRRTLDQVAQMLPQLRALMQAVGGDEPPASGPKLHRAS